MNLNLAILAITDDIRFTQPQGSVKCLSVSPATSQQYGLAIDFTCGVFSFHVSVTQRITRIGCATWTVGRVACAVLAEWPVRGAYRTEVSTNWHRKFAGFWIQVPDKLKECVHRSGNCKKLKGKEALFCEGGCGEDGADRDVHHAVDLTTWHTRFGRERSSVYVMKVLLFSWVLFALIYLL